MGMDYNKLYPDDDREGAVKLLCFDMTKASEKTRFVWCSIGVFFFYIIYGYLQELIFSLEGFREYGWYLTLIQFAYYTVFGILESKLRGVTRRIPLSTYIILAFLTLGTMGFSNSSLGYLNYPTQVIFKSCKLIPVLIGGILIQGKQYGLLDFVAAGFLCAGLVLFTLADSMISPRFSIIGVMMISSALLCDAIIGNVQEKAMRQYKATNTEIVLYSYSIGFLYLFIILFTTGQLTKGVTFCADYPIETYGYAFLFSISGYLGIQMVLTLVQTSGAFVAATVTTCRKAVTITLSFIFFYKPFTMQYLWSGLLVLLGIYLNIRSKQRGGNKVSLKTIWSYIQHCWSKHNQIQRQLMMNV
ncbi:adenosine 3'-phospho 5'-phosphosulfate transporter 2 [Cotesia glomerata]|uniref:Adenosine 3'-phospho 5'-phosphosulfate transporter 2 n=1 Tax=Cotesia glomerata TaxID=32391 RepID=A0AAV7HZI3_COTGL|nr:adenosine 3'-phospho 5'-phosphosulfate transporter 2 [Cotesia glomerata]XP_044576687.1 adenosine 3'-phospho 5'-phosphosulfate transporter 2 [Cotesia glomerata]KAH0540647.1 Adenosine 3'-phospho 5'-phosphosulfate transporter 2 [Cotesia glomerata]